MAYWSNFASAPVSENELVAPLKSNVKFKPVKMPIDTGPPTESTVMVGPDNVIVRAVPIASM